MLTDLEIKEFQEELLYSKKPLIFFDDDTDGSSAYILFYKFLKSHVESIKGIIVKSSPTLQDEMFLRKIPEYDPDKIFVLDKPMVSQDFIDAAKKPMIWLDHHPVQKNTGIKYFNPLKHKSKDFDPDNRPTTYWAYKIVDSPKNDMWIAMVGCIGDWFIPEFYKEFSNEYPDLLPPDLELKSPGTVLFETRLGLLCKIINFNLKYPSKEALTSIKILTRINDPREILDKTTSAGRYIYKNYDKLNIAYENIKSKIIVTDEKLLLLEYEDKYSLTSDLSNDIMYHNPDKLVLIARLKGDEYKCSFRSTNLDVRSIIEKALVGINGYGGGHKNACGGNVHMSDWSKFLEALRSELANATKSSDSIPITSKHKVVPKKRVSKKSKEKK